MSSISGIYFHIYAVLKSGQTFARVNARVIFNIVFIGRFLASEA